MQKFSIKYQKTELHSTLKGSLTIIKWDYPWEVRIFQHTQTNVTHHINWMKEKSHIIISIDTKKALWENSISIHKKNLKIRYREKSYQNNNDNIWQAHS